MHCFGKPRLKGIQLWLVTCAALLLQACGGGDSAPAAPPAPTAPPTPVISVTPATPKPGETVTLTAASSGTGLSFSWDFGDGTKGTGSTVTHSYPAEGAFALSVAVTNAAALSSTGNSTLNVVAQPPGDPVLTLSDAAPYPGQSLSLSVTSTDPQNSTLTYQWDFGDGQLLGGATQSRTYTSEGSYSVVVAVTNQFTKVTRKTFAIGVAYRAPAIATSSYLPNPVPNQSVSFSAVATDVQGSTLTYTWDFGDGSTATGNGVAHAYAAEGSFPAKLTVTNTFNKSTTVNLPVTVTARPPVIAFITISRTAPQPLQGVNFTSSVGDPQGSALTYRWDFGDGATASTPSASHTWTAEGANTVRLTVTNTYGKSASISTVVTVTAVPPTVPVVNQQPAKPKPGDVVTFTASSSDPQNSSVSYQWTFGDGGTATGASVTHSFSALGTYPVQAMATNGYGKSSTQTISTVVDYWPPDPPVITPASTIVQQGQSATFTATANDPGGYAISYSWNFGDGSSAVTGPTQTHSYGSNGRYTITVTATNTQNKSSSATASVGVSQLQVYADNQFGVFCGGANCGAMDAGTYLGSGKGIWRYNNTTGLPATINISIAGPMGSKRALMVYANGGTASTSVPDSGTSGSPLATPLNASAAAAVPAIAAEGDRFLGGHEQMLARNQRLALELIQSRGGATANAAPAAAPVAAAPPAIGSTRIWIDYYTSTVSYTAAVAAVCSSPRSGRNIVFWLDSTFTSFPQSRLDAFQAAFCGAAGGYDAVTGLLGDAWGATQPAYQSVLIQDTPTLQDINVVILNVPASTGWAGYFYGGNNYQSNGNHALAFFINGLSAATTSQDYYVSTLTHELTHMVNFYQRSVQKGASHDTWLEETSAMMSEDIITPTISPTGYNSVGLVRVPTYYSSGAAVSLINWPSLSSAHYAMGGSLGAFLSRRFGTSLFQEIGGCGTTPATTGTSHHCVDVLIQNRGGGGYAEEFARYGVSLFGRLGSSGVPAGFGYPALNSQGFALQGFPLETTLGNLPSATALSGNLPASSHTYTVDTLGANATSWVRNNVVVPPNSTLVVVIR